LHKSVDGLRRINAPYGVEFRLSTLAVALAWRGDDVDILPVAREAFDHHRLLGVTFGPLMAAALQHATRNDARRAVLLAGYACCKLPLHEPPSLIALPVQQRVRDCAAARHPAASIEAWLRAGECLTEEQAAAIAFDGAPLDELSSEQLSSQSNESLPASPSYSYAADRLAAAIVPTTLRPDPETESRNTSRSALVR
jgi:hypothetical protein